MIPLSKLLVREKGDTKDSKGIYLICQSKTEPEMYELVCRTPDERKYWIKTIKMSIAHCLEQGTLIAHLPKVLLNTHQLTHTSIFLFDHKLTDFDFRN